MNEISLQTLKPNRKRACAPKVRTGCVTCKKRHIKCDEKKPECIRCITTGKKCEGYIYFSRNGVIAPDRNSCPLARRVSLGLDGHFRPFSEQSPKELRSIQFFLLKAAPHLAGYFQDRFWKLALQVSAEEASILHALIAISLAYEAECTLLEPCSQAVLNRLLFVHYNRAIRLMVKNLQGTSSALVLIVGCLLFVCLDFLRRDFQSAVNHIDGGIKMIEQFRAKRKNSTYEMDFIEWVIVPLLSSLNVTAVVFGRKGVYIYSKNGEPEPALHSSRPMSNMDDAITSLLDLANSTARHINQVKERKRTIGALGSSDFISQENLLKMHMNWRDNFAKLEKEQGDLWTGNASKGRNVLKANHLTSYLQLCNSCSPYEEAWDTYKAQFEELIQFVEEVIDDHLQVQSKLFSFELGIIPSLEVVARKCRYPKLRRQAIALLHKLPKRECLFDPFYSAVLDERAMELEEMALNVPVGQIPKDDQLPPEHSRVHEILFSHETQNHGSWPVRFLSKPKGPNKAWHVHNELFELKESTKWSPIVSLSSDFGTSLRPHVGASMYDELSKLRAGSSASRP